MVEKLHVKNYQGHEDTVIIPAPSLTSITGRSHHGKTSLVRSAIKLQTNRPLGTKFIRKGTKEAYVAIDNVELIVTGSKVKYKVDGEPFSAIGRGAVPDEVTDALNLSADNIQDQHSKPFLLDDSPGKVAQKLSELVDLDYTSKSLKYISSVKRKISDEVAVTQSNIKQTEVIIDELEHIEAISERYAKIERKWVKVEHLNKTHMRLYTAHQNAVQAKIKLSETPDVKPALEQVESINKHMQEIRAIEYDIKKLDDTIDEVVALEALLKCDASPVLESVNEAIKLSESCESLDAAITAAKLAEGKVANIKKRHDELKAKIDEYSGEPCPLCGGEL